MHNFLGLDACNQPEAVSIRRNTYNRLLANSTNFVMKRGIFYMPNYELAAGAAVFPTPWYGTKSLDFYIVPKGSVLDVTNIVFSMRIDPNTPNTGPSQGSLSASTLARAMESFNYGAIADDLYLDPTKNRFFILVNRQTPFQIGYTYRQDTLSNVFVPDDNDPQPSPASELALSRYNGTSVLNRNILTQGDLNFHLLVREDQALEFQFQTEAEYGPRADVEVQWCGRIIPKTVFEEVIKANG
jgi:hypothetical protein